MIRLGTKCVFGIPGEGASLLLINELEKHGCRFYIAAHEAAGALMAGGYGRLAGIPGISLSIKGPGFSNMLAGIASNWLDRNPALSLSESYGPGAPSFRMHKRMDHGAMVRPVSKAYADNSSPSLFGTLWETCLAEEPGPVHLNISQRMDQTHIEGDSALAKSSNPCLLKLRESIQAASRPIVIAGSLASRRPWGRRLGTLNVPVFTTFAGKGAIDEMHPFSAGVFTNSGGIYSPESALLPEADLILGIGLRTSEIIDVKRLPAALFLLDESPGRGDGLEASLELSTTVEGIVEIIDILADKEWGRSEIATAKALLEAKLAVDRWLPSGAYRLSQQMLPESTIFFLDTGSFCTIGEHALIAQRPLHILGSALGRSMGVCLPNAVGAAIAARGTPVVAVTGDGGMRLYPECISIAVKEKLPMLVMLMTDGYFSSIRQVAVEKGLSQNNLRMDSAGWIGAVEAWGCPSERVESLSAMQRALVAWKDSPSGPLFLELAFNSDAYMAMTDGIR